MTIYDCLRQLKTPLRLLTIMWKPALMKLSNTFFWSGFYTEGMGCKCGESGNSKGRFRRNSLVTTKRATKT